MNKDNNNFDNNSTLDNVTVYEQSLKRLQNIVEKVENQDVSLSDLIQNMEVANELVQECKDRLRTIEQNLNPEI